MVKKTFCCSKCNAKFELTIPMTQLRSIPSFPYSIIISHANHSLNVYILNSKGDIGSHFIRKIKKKANYSHFFKILFQLDAKV